LQRLLGVTALQFLLVYRVAGKRNCAVVALQYKPAPILMSLLSVHMLSHALK